jgi:hypothetical protein
MKMVTAMAVEQVTDGLAQKARDFAENLSPDISGKDALLAFAAAIEATNAKQYPKTGRGQ